MDSQDLSWVMKSVSCVAWHGLGCSIAPTVLWAFSFLCTAFSKKIVFVESEVSLQHIVAIEWRDSAKKQGSI